MIKDFNKYNEFITEYCKYFCPKGTIGCGLSHYILLNHIYNGKLQGYKNKFTLILEDDVTPLFENKIYIIDIIDHIPDDCDILMLYCMGTCQYNTHYNDILNNSKFIYKKPKSRIIGSTAAYLIRNSAIPKLLKKNLFFHVDVQWYNTIFDSLYIYYKPLFYADNTTSDVNESNYNSKLLKQIDYFFPINADNMTTARFLTYPFIRIPVVDITINTFNVLQLVLIIILFVFTYYILLPIIKKNENI